MKEVLLYNYISMAEGVTDRFFLPARRAAASPSNERVGLMRTRALLAVALAVSGLLVAIKMVKVVV